MIPKNNIKRKEDIQSKKDALDTVLYEQHFSSNMNNSSLSILENTLKDKNNTKIASCLKFFKNFVFKYRDHVIKTFLFVLNYINYWNDALEILIYKEIQNIIRGQEVRENKSSKKFMFYLFIQNEIFPFLYLTLKICKFAFKYYYIFYFFMISFFCRMQNSTSY